MSDSDMDIDDDEVEQKVKVQEQAGDKDNHTIGGESEMLDKPIQGSNSQNDVRNHSVTEKLESCQLPNPLARGNLTIPSDQQSKTINFQALAEYRGTLSRFPAPGLTPKIFSHVGEGNGPQQKRAALPCKFFAKGWCFNGMSCKFLHVKDLSHCTSQQQAVINMSGSKNVQSDVERRISESKEGVRVPQLSENGKTFLCTREGISYVNPPDFQRVFPSMSFVNPPGSQRIFPSPNELRLISLSENIRRESLNLKQTCGADVTDNRSLAINNSNSFTLRSSFVHEPSSSINSYVKTDIGSSRPAWTGSFFSSVPMTESASTVGNFENGNSIHASGSLPTLQGIAVSSDKDAEGNSASNKKKASSDDWEPSEPFKASFTIPPYILPSSDALYDPFLDIENPEDRSCNASLSSKGEHARQNSGQQKGDDSASGPQARECKNDDKSSSCCQNKHHETMVRRNSEIHGAVEGMATSVFDQNDTSPPGKEISLEAAAENRIALKRIKPVGIDSWHRSDGSSYKKTLKVDEIDGEVRSSDAGTKVMRQFRTAVVETIKEMVKPLWRDGRLSKDVHNMIVKKATEKVVSTAIQFHQVPTDTGSVEQYLSVSSAKIVKLVEGYVEKFGKPLVIKPNAHSVA